MAAQQLALLLICQNTEHWDQLRPINTISASVVPGSGLEQNYTARWYGGLAFVLRGAKCC
ncbi:protein of unknown function (plasmid) [Cupriavidus taiwanensis]|uniref:Uncharacterized protein n=1 Tax=Cupriavidus taiwanensis TaxID=164546 RepID=A0A375IWU3_9BURK|nr:protein of unknown function [Cupriavidus taiwanensis]